MPRAYESMRDKFAKSMDYDTAQAKAAAIYNSKHADNPVTSGSRRHKARKALARYK